MMEPTAQRNAFGEVRGGAAGVGAGAGPGEGCGRACGCGGGGEGGCGVRFLPGLGLGPIVQPRAAAYLVR